jgi:hypothetical protein
VSLPRITPLVSLLLAAGAQAQDGRIAGAEAPSGQQVTLSQVIAEEDPWSGAMQIVVRLVAPAIAGDTRANSQLREDMDWACRTWGVPAAQEVSATPDRVVVEMMAEPAPRGEATPGIRRIFESYRLEGPDCVWELF